jgi:hypothetical protein
MGICNEFRKNQIYMYRRKSLKFDSGEEIKPSTECTYLGTKIDQTEDKTQN